MQQSNIFVDGIEYYAQAFRVTGIVDVYCNDRHIASCQLDGNTEQALVEYYDSEGETHSSSSSQLFFEHDGKTEQDLLEDLGSWLAATHPESQ